MPQVVGSPATLIGLLDCHGDAEQRPLFASLQRSVCLRSCQSRPFEIAHHHCIDRAVEGLDARDRAIDKLSGRELPPRQSRRELGHRVVLEPGGRLRLRESPYGTRGGK
jgi:hypothetical protein